MKSWILTTSLTLLLLSLSACGGATPANPEKAVIDASLAKIVLTAHGKERGMKSLAFEWKSITDKRVLGIYVYKKSPTAKGAGKQEYYKTIESRYSTHYVDTDVVPNTQYSYMFKTFSENAEGPAGREIRISTLPVLDSVSWLYVQADMPRSAKIIWRPHTNQKVEYYIVQRKTLEEEEWSDIAKVKGRLNVEYIDTDLKDNFVYEYRIKVLTYDDIVSKQSQKIKVVTKALPHTITGIKATTSLPKKIVITWTKSTQEDFALYYLYRSTSIDEGYKLIAKLHNNRFEDEIKEDAKSYFYRVSAVDKDGLESLHDQSSIQGMTLSRPDAPAIISAKLKNNVVTVHWRKTDPRAVTYSVLRKHKKGWFDEKVEEFTGIKGTEFIDTNIVAGSTYKYYIYGVDKNGIESEASTEALITTPESKEVIQAVASDKKEVVIHNEPAKEQPKDVVDTSNDLDLSGI